MEEITKCDFPRLRTIRVRITLPRTVDKVLHIRSYQVEHFFLDMYMRFSALRLMPTLRVLSLDWVSMYDVEYLRATLQACANRLLHIRFSNVWLPFKPDTIWIPGAQGYCQERPEPLELPVLESLRMTGMRAVDALGFFQHVKLRRNIPLLHVELNDDPDVMIRNVLKETVRQDFGAEVHAETPRVIFAFEGVQESWISI
jgi:hypothetical protein